MEWKLIPQKPINCVFLLVNIAIYSCCLTKAFPPSGFGDARDTGKGEKKQAINYQLLRLKTPGTQITFHEREKRGKLLQIEKHFAQVYISDPEGSRRQKFYKSKTSEESEARKAKKVKSIGKVSLASCCVGAT